MNLGLPLRETIAIDSPARLSDVLRAAGEHHRPVVPIGGGVCLPTGNVTDTPFTALDMTPLDGVENYIATDLTASFLAGTRLRDIKRTLAEHGQELPIDIPDDDDGTIGGWVATGFSGPRRLGSGSLKDLLIGCEYVRGDGLFAKAGGMTVKNVSGYEVSRFLHGSWGTLAVLTRVNLKVLPIPRADVTVIQPHASLTDCLTGQQGLLRGIPTAAAVVSEWHGADYVLSLRLLGNVAAIDAQLARIQGGDITRIDDNAPWLAHAQRWRTSAEHVDLVVGGDAQPLSTFLTGSPIVSRAAAGSVSLGTRSARLRFDPAIVTFDEIAQAMSSHSVVWMIEGAPSAWKAGHDVWGPVADDGGLVARIRDEFDPARILDRGRMRREERE